MSQKYTINSPKTNKLNKNNKINKKMNKLVKTFGSIFRNPNTFGDVNNIPPVYM